MMIMKHSKWILRKSKPLLYLSQTIITKPELQNEKSAMSDGFTFVFFFHKNNELIKQILH